MMEFPVRLILIWIGFGIGIGFVSAQETNYLGIHVQNARVGPIVLPTVAQIWPKPQLEVDYEAYLLISMGSFEFQVPTDFRIRYFHPKP
jgi:hypothetical protein